MNNQHISTLDGVRALAAIGIVLMHIRANTDYEIDGYFYNKIIPSFTDFVYIFMALSAFGLCCGYYEKVKTGSISLSKFYNKRFYKILPFFACLLFLDLAVSPSVDSLYEVFACLTLMFGFLPDAGNFSVIGVGWFVGMIFVFYLIFPFFCTLLETKGKAWFAFIIAIGLNLSCTYHFNLGRHNIIYCFVFLLIGGLIFKYLDILKKIANIRNILLLLIFSFILAFSVYFYLSNYQSLIGLLLVTSCTIVVAISLNFKHGLGRYLLSNKLMSFLSSISMEIYLCHMVIFRGWEKFGLTAVTENHILQYIITSVLTVLGAIAFSYTLKSCISLVSAKFHCNK